MTTRKTKTSRQKGQSPDENTRPIDILRPAVLDLVAVMDRAVNMADESLTLNQVLDLLDGIGKTSARLATILKAEQQLAEGGKNMEAFDQAVAELFGDRAIFQPEGYDGENREDKPEPS